MVSSQNEHNFFYMSIRENKRFFTNFSTYHVEKVISGEDYFVGREGFTDDPKVIFQGN